MKTIYPASGRVSIWIGIFDSEDDFDSEIDSIITPALGLPCDIAEICEMTFEPESVPVQQLLTGFSGDASFMTKAVKAATESDWGFANSALVCYHLDVQDSPVPSFGRFRFLGSFSGTDIAA